MIQKLSFKIVLRKVPHWYDVQVSDTTMLTIAPWFGQKITFAKSPRNISRLTIHHSR